MKPLFALLFLLAGCGAPRQGNFDPLPYAVLLNQMAQQRDNYSRPGSPFYPTWTSCLSDQFGNTSCMNY